jgi:hypothetical protein
MNRREGSIWIAIKLENGNVLGRGEGGGARAEWGKGAIGHGEQVGLEETNTHV